MLQILIMNRGSFVDLTAFTAPSISYYSVLSQYIFSWITAEGVSFHGGRHTHIRTKFYAVDSQR